MPITFEYQSADYLAQQAGKLDYGDLPNSSKLRNPLHVHLATVPAFNIPGDSGTWWIPLAELPIGARIIPNLCTLPALTFVGATVDGALGTTFSLVLGNDQAIADNFAPHPAIAGLAQPIVDWTKIPDDALVRNDKDQTTELVTTRGNTKVFLCLTAITTSDAVSLTGTKDAVIAYQLP